MFDYIILYGNALEGVVDAIGTFNSESQCEDFMEEFPTQKHLNTKIICLIKPDDGEWSNTGW